MAIIWEMNERLELGAWQGMKEDGDAIIIDKKWTRVDININFWDISINGVNKGSVI